MGICFRDQAFGVWMLSAVRGRGRGRGREESPEAAAQRPLVSSGKFTGWAARLDRSTGSNVIQSLSQV